MNRVQETLIIMGYIYNPDGFDWMNYKLTDCNPYTYHHIVERRSGGHTTVGNGAILTEVAHNLLNILDQFCKEAYNDLQNIFIRINGSGEPPTYEIMKEVDNILYKLFFTNEYHFTVNLDSDKFCKIRFCMNKCREMYVESRKELKKCLL
jgi:hypothetical protein